MKNRLVMKFLAMGLVALIGMAPMNANAATPIYHTHVGSVENGTGCYSRTLYHNHTGSDKEKGGCYTKANYHSHEGDSVNGEGCFSVVKYHSHSGNETSGGGCYTKANYHSHSGNETSGGECYTKAKYHSHSGNETSGGGCYTKANYHSHSGNETSGGGCYTTPVYHSHSGSAELGTQYAGGVGYPCSATSHGCYTKAISVQWARNCGTFLDSDGDGMYNCHNCGATCPQNLLPTPSAGEYLHRPIGTKTVYTLGCGKNAGAIEKYAQSCTKTTSTVESYSLDCGKTTSTIEGYSLTCGKTTSTVESYSLDCGKTTSTIEGYSLGCGKSASTIESYSLGCGKVTTTIEGYALGCGKTTSTIEGYKDEPGQDAGNSLNENNNGETDSGSDNKKDKVTDTTKEQGKADTTELDENDVVGNKSYSNPSNLIVQTGVNGSTGNEGISGSESGAGEELNKESMNVVEPAAGVGLVMNPGVLAGVGVVGGGLGAGFFLLFGLLGSTPATLSIATIKGTEERKIKVKNKKNYYVTKISNKWIEYASSASIQLEQEFINKHRGEQLKVIIDDTEYVTTVSENITFDLT